MTDLDDELPDDSEAALQNSPQKTTQPGKWRSVRSLAQFWELMAFRQECGAGRLVGFLWGVFEPSGLIDRPFEARVPLDEAELEATKGRADPETDLPTPQVSQAVPADAAPLPSAQPLEQPLPGDSLVSPPASSQAQPLEPPLQRDSLDSRPTSSQVQPPEISKLSNGTESVEAAIEIPILNAKADLGSHDASSVSLTPLAYSKMMALLDTLDYANVAAAKKSTDTFLEAVAKEACLGDPWKGFEVLGPKAVKEDSVHADRTLVERETAVKQDDGVPMLSQGLVKRKKRAASGAAEADAPVALREKGEASTTSGPKLLTAGLVRKKPKV